MTARPVTWLLTLGLLTPRPSSLPRSAVSREHQAGRREPSPWGLRSQPSDVLKGAEKRQPSELYCTHASVSVGMKLWEQLRRQFQLNARDQQVASPEQALQLGLWPNLPLNVQEGCRPWAAHGEGLESSGRQLQWVDSKARARDTMRH